jgi:hypothetical protein
MNAPGKIVRRSSGLTLMELLCVIAAIYLGVIFKAFLHVKHKFGN